MIVTVSVVRTVVSYSNGFGKTYGRPHPLAHELGRLVVVDA